MYRIYVGEYVKEGLPNTWTLVHISKIYPSGILNKLKENIKYGMDIYITKNNKLIKRQYGEVKNSEKPKKLSFSHVSNLSKILKSLFNK